MIVFIIPCTLTYAGQSMNGLLIFRNWQRDKGGKSALEENQHRVDDVNL